MRRILSLLLLAPTLVLAQQASAPAASTSAPQASASSEDVPPVVRLATQKVTIPAAQLPLITLEGKALKLGDIQAKVTVVVVWSSLFSSQPRLELLEAARRSYAGDAQVAFLAVNIDMPKGQEEREGLRDIAQEVKAGYPILVDPELKLLATLLAKSQPRGAVRNSLVLPPVAFFTRGYEVLEMPDLRGDTTEEWVKSLRAEVERLRRGK